MNKRLFALGLVALASLTTFVGCAGDTDEAPDAVEGEEDDLTARQLPGVVSVEIAEVRMQTEVLSTKTVGAPKKVKSLVAAVRKLRPSEPVPRCMLRDTTRLTFSDAAGKKVATMSSHCGGYGNISFENGTTGYGVKFDGAAVDAAKTAPFAVGDALYGISKIEIAKPGSDQKKTYAGADLEPMLEGFDLDEVPNASASFPRCLPSHSVTFKRGNDSVAFTSFMCGAGSEPPASLKARFTAVDPKAKEDSPALASGAITIDPRPIVRAFAQ